MGVEGSASSEAIVKAVEDGGYGAKLCKAQGGAIFCTKFSKPRRRLLRIGKAICKRRLVTSVVFLLVLMYFSMGHTMFHLPLPKTIDGNHIGITLYRWCLAAIVMFINKEVFVSRMEERAYNFPTWIHWLR